MLIVVFFFCDVMIDMDMTEIELISYDIFRQINEPIKSTLYKSAFINLEWVLQQAGCFIDSIHSYYDCDILIQ